jgi:hypothetical protein
MTITPREVELLVPILRKAAITCADDRAEWEFMASEKNEYGTLRHQKAAKNAAMAEREEQAIKEFLARLLAENETQRAAATAADDQVMQILRDHAAREGLDGE